MAKKKKSRVPPPPKRTVQAPRAYHAPRDPRRTRLVLLALGAAVLIAAAVVGIALAAGGGDGGGGIEASEVCQVEDFSPMGRRHVEELAEDFEYNSVPATSGPHYGQPRGPAIWNLYTEPVQQERVVHNLEHGGIVVQYGSEVPQATVAAIADWYGDDPRGVVVAPLLPELAKERPELASKIAVTAWTHLMTCDDFDEEAFDDFVDEHRGPGGDAPEEFPLDALQPGSQ